MTTKCLDFILHKKSPLYDYKIGRPDMGSNWTSPNFAPLISLVSHLVQSDLIEKYPLSEVENEMLFHPEFLKVVFASEAGSKDFGQCLT